MQVFWRKKLATETCQSDYQNKGYAKAFLANQYSLNYRSNSLDQSTKMFQLKFLMIMPSIKI